MKVVLLKNVVFTALEGIVTIPSETVIILDIDSGIAYDPKTQYYFDLRQFDWKALN